jgi:hypothetical protein
VPDLTQLLAEGKTYYWALRHALQEQRVPGGNGDGLREAGIDLPTLAALKQLEPSIARFPHPVAKRADHQYLEVPIPPDMTVYLAPLVTERGVEVGTELFPMLTRWTFAHNEIQYCLGGQTPIDAILPHNARQSKHFGVGDVMAIPGGTRLTFHSSEDGRAGHAHIYLVNLSGGEPRTFYDVVPFLRLQQFGLVDAPDGPEPPPLHDVRERIEVLDWAELLSPRAGRSHELPSWLCNGWERREATRALDYQEGGRSLVITAPDREPADYLPWGEGESACWVNPLVAEPSAAVTDCRLPAGYFRSQAATEVWTVLRGSAHVHQTLAPLHVEESDEEVEGGSVLVVPGGSRLTVRDASEDLVVRRLAQSCAHNGHWAMMEAKLLQDGVDKDL